MAEDSGEDRICLDTLSEEDLSHIATNERYKQLLVDLLGPSITLPGDGKEGKSVDSTPQSKSAADPSRIQVVGADHPSCSPTGSTSSLDRDNVPYSENHGHNEPSEDDPPPAKRPRKENQGEYLFDPVEVGKKDDFHFNPPEVVKKYIEKYFRRVLSKQERAAMLKADPKPKTPAGAPPTLDEHLQTFWRQRLDLKQDNELKDIQNAVLYTACPLAGLWSQIVEQDLDKDPEALIQVPIVLEALQKALVL